MIEPSFLFSQRPAGGMAGHHGGYRTGAGRQAQRDKESLPGGRVNVCVLAWQPPPAALKYCED